MPKFESLGDWIEKIWETQEALGDKLGVARNTVSQWASGKSRIKPPIQEKLRKLGYDGPWPATGGAEITREDLEALRRDLRDHQGWALEETRKGMQGLENKLIALGAILQEVLKRLPPK